MPISEHPDALELKERGYGNLKQRLGPEAGLLDEFAGDELAGAVIGHGEEGADEVAVIGEDAGMKVENAYTDCAD